MCHLTKFLTQPCRTCRLPTELLAHRQTTPCARAPCADSDCTVTPIRRQDYTWWAWKRLLRQNGSRPEGESVESRGVCVRCQGLRRVLGTGWIAWRWVGTLFGQGWNGSRNARGGADEGRPRVDEEMERMRVRARAAAVEAAGVAGAAATARARERFQATPRRRTTTLVGGRKVPVQTYRMQTYRGSTVFCHRSDDSDDHDENRESWVETWPIGLSSPSPSPSRSRPSSIESEVRTGNDAEQDTRREGEGPSRVGLYRASHQISDFDAEAAVEDETRRVSSGHEDGPCVNRELMPAVEMSGLALCATGNEDATRHRARQHAYECELEAGGDSSKGKRKEREGQDESGSGERSGWRRCDEKNRLEYRVWWRMWESEPDDLELESVN